MLDRWLAKSREHAPWLLLGVAAIVLVVHSLAYNFVTDDAYISFVYSRNLAEHGELAFNLGDPVEGYTNFSWTVLIGAFMKLGVSPEISSRLLGTLCALGTLYVVFRTMQRALGRRSAWAAVPSLLLASSSGFACWTSGGLETQLFTLLVAAALDAVVAATENPRAIRRAGWLLALAAMTRPEGPLIAAVLGVAHGTNVVLVLLAKRKLPDQRPFPFADEAFAAAWFLGLWGPWFAWRWWYYGYPFPNTYYVKASGDWADPKQGAQMIDHGFYYLWVWLKQTRVVYALAPAAVGLVAGLVRPRSPRFVLALACTLIAAFYVPYAVSVGGDFMGLHRFIMPMFVVAAIVVVLGLEWLAGWVSHDRAERGAWIVFGALGVAIAGYGTALVVDWLEVKHVAPIAATGAAALAVAGGLGWLVARLARRVPNLGTWLVFGALGLAFAAYATAIAADWFGLRRIEPVVVAGAVAIAAALGGVAHAVAVDRRNLAAWVAIGVAGLASLGFAVVVVLELVVDVYDPRVGAALLGSVAVLVAGLGFRRGLRAPTTLAAVLACMLLVGASADTQLELTRRSLDPKNLAADRGVIDTPAFLIVYTEDRAKIGLAMESCFRDTDFSIVGGAGAQPYYARMRGIDVFGLVSDRIAHEEKRSRARAGHTKWGSDPLLAAYDPDFVFSCYDIRRTAAQPQLPCAGFWRARGFEEVTLRIPGLLERGEYYTFLAKKARNFECPGRVH